MELQLLTLVVVVELEISLLAHLTVVQMEAQVAVDKAVHINLLVEFFQQQELQTLAVEVVEVLIIV